MMATLKPFRGLRYNTQKISMSQVIAPPYDVISEKEREELYRLSEHNVIRLILGKDTPKDNESDNRYTRAKSSLENWLREKVLIQDEKPCFYIYRQVFRDPQKGESKIRQALFSLLRLEDFERGVVFPHEKTYPRPKADRLNLLNQTHANLSPVFGLYEDNRGDVSKIFSGYFKKPFLFEAEDSEGIKHQFWKIEDDQTIQKIIDVFRAKKIVLADGHHRYETALNHRNQFHQNGCEFVLISLVDIKDPGLLVLPTHRLLRKPEGFLKERFLKELTAYFELTKVDPIRILAELDRLSPLEKGFGLYLGKEEACLAKLKSQDAIRPFAPRDKSSEWAALEVSILSYVVLEKLLDLKENQFENFLVYTRNEKEAFERVDTGDFVAAFLLRSIPVSEIQKVCERRDLLPHKSTYFYPKLASGLVFYHHDLGNHH